MTENHPEKCLCTYCSGSKFIVCFHRFESLFLAIAKEMTAWNEKNLSQCEQIVDSYDQNPTNFDQLTPLLDSLNPVQCFDVLNKLCRKCSSTTENAALDQLIVHYIVRFRSNGGFFLALKQASNQREHLLHRLTDSILTKQEYAQKTNLTAAELH